MKEITGRIVSTKMAKTAVVLVERFKIHPFYQKRIRLKKKYHVDNEIGALVGDLVRLSPCRPLSKTKKWRIAAIVEKKESK